MLMRIYHIERACAYRVYNEKEGVMFRANELAETNFLLEDLNMLRMTTIKAIARARPSKDFGEVNDGGIRRANDGGSGKKTASRVSAL